MAYLPLAQDLGQEEEEEEKDVWPLAREESREEGEKGLGSRSGFLAPLLPALLPAGRRRGRETGGEEDRPRDLAREEKEEEERKRRWGEQEDLCRRRGSVFFPGAVVVEDILLWRQLDATGRGGTGVKYG